MTFTFDQMMGEEGLPAKKSRYAVRHPPNEQPINPDNKLVANARGFAEDGFRKLYGEEPAAFAEGFSADRRRYVCMVWAG